MEDGDQIDAYLEQVCLFPVLSAIEERALTATISWGEVDKPCSLTILRVSVCSFVFTYKILPFLSAKISNEVL